MNTAPPTVPVYELAIGVGEADSVWDLILGDGDRGWIGWEIRSERPDGSVRIYSFDERSKTNTLNEAIRRVKRREAAVLGPGVALTLQAREIRTLVSAELCPN